MGILDRSTAFRAVVLGSGRGGPTDPLAALDDSFTGGSTDIETRGWSIYKPAALANTTVDTGLGQFAVEIANGGGGAEGSFWFDLSDGVLVYKAVTGDCEMTARYSVQNTAGDGTPTETGFRLVGIAAHDPDRSTVFNYEHAALGVTNGVGQSAEYKDTIDSDSGANSGTLPGFGSVVAGSYDAWIRLTRVGDVWTMAYSLDDETYTTIHTANRTTNPLPATLQWGLMCYAQPVTHDIRGICHGVTFRTP